MNPLPLARLRLLVWTLLAALLPCPTMAGAPIDERWYRVSLQGTPTGWTREATSPFADTTESSMRLARHGATIEFRGRTIECRSRDGRADSLNYRIVVGGADTTRVELRVDPDSVRWWKWGEGKRERRSAPRARNLVSARERSRIFRQGCADRAWEFSSFVPDFETVAWFVARCEGADSVAASAVQVSSGPTHRWRLTARDIPGMEMIEWWQDSTCVAREMPQLGIREELVPRLVALSERGAAELTLLSRFRLRREFAPDSLYPRVVWRMRAKDAGPLPPEPQLASERVVATGRRHRDVEVRALLPAAVPVSREDSLRLARAPEFRPALQAAPLVESNAPELREAAARATEATTYFGQAVDLTRLVHEHVHSKDYSVAYAGAAETWESGTGDCTEHSILLAALLRCRGIPSRLVGGLLATGSEMEYHQWTEAWDGAAWIGLDPTFNRAPIDARYLALAVSDLSDGTGALTRGLLGVLGRIEVQPLEVDRALGKSIR